MMSKRTPVADGALSGWGDMATEARERLHIGPGPMDLSGETGAAAAGTGCASRPRSDGGDDVLDDFGDNHAERLDLADAGVGAVQTVACFQSAWFWVTA